MRKFLIIIIIVLIFYIGATYLLNIFLPEKIDTAVKKFTHDYLGKKITISQINISILRGIYLEKVKIVENDNKTPFLSVNTIHLIPFYPSLLSEKKLFFSVNIDGVNFSLKRKADNTFELPRISFQAEKSQGKEEKLSKTKNKSDKKEFFIIKDIYVKGLNLGFTDETVNFKKNLNNVYAWINLRLPQRIKAKIKWQDKISVKADYDLISKDLNAFATLDEIQLKEFAPYFKQASIQNGYLDEATIEIKGKENYLLKINVKADDISIKKDESEIKTDISINGTASIYNKNLSYNLAGKISKSIIKSSPYFDSIQIQNALITLNEKKLQLSNIDATFYNPQGKISANEAKINLRANLDFDFEKSEIYIEAKTSSSIINLLNTLKNTKIDVLKNLSKFDYNKNGNIDLSLTLKNNLTTKITQYYLDYKIKGAGYKDLENIWAKGFVKNDLAVIEDCSLNYKNIPLKVAASLESFSKPHLTLGIKSEITNILLNTTYNKNIFDINSLIIKTKNSKVSSTGSLDSKNSLLELECMSNIDLEEILSIFNTYKIKPPILAKLNPKGIVNAKFIITGPLKPRDWQVKLAGRSEKIKIYNLEADNATIELYYDKDLLIISPFDADVADGKIDLRAKIDFKNNKMSADMLINDISLESIRKQLNLKSKNLSGILSLDLNFENASLSKLDKLNGSGKISIKEGNIWELNFLKGLGEFLFIPEFEGIKFEEGQSDLTLKGENVVFENIELKSYQMNLKGSGRISVNGDLNFILVSEFNSNLINASGGLKKILTTVLGQTALTIDLKGTIQKPTYKVQPAALSDLEGFKKILDRILK